MYKFSIKLIIKKNSSLNKNLTLFISFSQHNTKFPFSLCTVLRLYKDVYSA